MVEKSFIFDRKDIYRKRINKTGKHMCQVNIMKAVDLNVDVRENKKRIYRNKSFKEE